MKTVLHKTIILAVILLYTSASFCQKNQVKKADKEFDKFAYIDAQKIYLKVVKDGYDSAQIYANLGDTYYFNSDYNNAAKWYGKLLDKYPGDAEVVYYYRAAQSFKSINKYEESDKFMIAYSALGGEGLIVKNFETNQDYLKTIAFHAKGYELEKVSVNTNASDFGPSYYMDKLVYATSTKNTERLNTHQWNEQPFLDLFIADMDENGVLSNAEPLSGEINTRYHESSTAFTKDGITVYFTRNNFIDGKKGRDSQKTIRLKLYRATKSGDNFWTNIVELPFNSKEYSVAHPALSIDEKRLYFSSDMEGSFGMSDLWYVDLLGDNTYSDPVNLGASINTEARESFPYISESNNMYFSSDGRAGLGGYDIFVTPLDENGKTGEIINLGEPVNSNQDDFGFIINEEKRIGYLSSNRDGENGSIADDIYRVQELCEVTITGIVTNDVTGAPIAGATVTLLDENNTVVKTVTTGADGRYSFDGLAQCSSTYIVRGIGDGCEFNEKVVVTPNTTSTIEADLPLECDPCAANDLGCRLKLQPIYFDFDRYNIRPDAEIELAKILAAMRQYPQLVIHIESHTDSRGNDSYNESLSEKRAQSTLEWLVTKGISRNRLSAKGYGEYQLTNQCTNGIECTEEEHQLNRRSMFIIQN